MRKIEIIGLAVVAATAFGVWSADTVANSKVAKAEVAWGPGSDLTACDYVAVASRRNTGRILTERYRGFRATYNSPSRAPPLRPACEPATASARQLADAAPIVICTYGGAGCRRTCW